MIWGIENTRNWQPAQGVLFINNVSATMPWQQDILYYSSLKLNHQHLWLLNAALLDNYHIVKGFVLQLFGPLDCVAH